jgi:threonine dehydratase
LRLNRKPRVEVSAQNAGGRSAELAPAQFPLSSLPAGPSLADITEASRRIAGFAHRTPLERSAWLSKHAGHDVYLKLECWQRTRSFKARGAYNALAALPAELRERGLVTASAGNHGQAVALAASVIGARAIVFVPATAPEVKKERIRSFGAELRDHEPDYDSAEAAAEQFARAQGMTFVHAYSDPAVVAGQGTIGLEILDDLPSVQCVIVPVGGGGIISGMGLVLKNAASAVLVLGVQSDKTTAMYDAFQAGRTVDSPIPPTLADGLAGKTDEISYQRAQCVIDQLLLVDESGIAPAIRGLYRYDGIVAEGAGAVGVAALLQNRVALQGPTVLVVTGGNIDAARLSGILSSD